MGATGNTPASITPPDRVESRLGTLEFNDGAPSPATAELLYDHLDFIQGVQAFINAFPGASLAAMHDGFLSIGVQDNEILLFSELMDSASLFLTANCDTVYFITFIDLADGPMVLDVPPFGPPSGILGAIDDMWFRWVTDFGVSGPDRAQGGRYLIIGPGYDGPVPDSGFHVSHSRTRRVIAFGRAFMIDNDPAPAAKVIRDGIRISPYVPGAQGTPISTFLTGNAPFGPVPDQAEPVFIEGSGKAFNTVPPNDFSYWETVNELVQQEPAGAGEPETMGAARGRRDRQGQVVRAQRSHAQDPPGCRGRRQRNGAHSLVRAASRGRLCLLSRLRLVQHAVHRRLRVPRSATADHGRRARR